MWGHDESFTSDTKKAAHIKGHAEKKQTWKPQTLGFCPKSKSHKYFSLYSHSFELLSVTFYSNEIWKWERITVQYKFNLGSKFAGSVNVNVLTNVIKSENCNVDKFYYLFWPKGLPPPEVSHGWIMPAACLDEDWRPSPHCTSSQEMKGDGHF